MHRTKLLAILSIGIGLLAPLLAAEIVLRFLPVRTGLQSLPVTAASPVRRFAPNREFTFSKNWNFDLVNRGRTNNLGFIHDLDYDSTARTPLLAVLGDSYIEAQMVPFSETVHGRLSRCVASRGRVYSFGASGAPLSAYLGQAAYARARFRPDGIVVVVVGNDFDESLRQFNGSPGLDIFRRDSSGLVLERRDYIPTWDRRLLRQSALARYVILNLAGGISKAQRLLRGDLQDGTQYVGNTAASYSDERLEGSRKVVDRFLADLPSYSGVPPERTILIVDGMRPAIYSERDLQAAKGSFFDLMRHYLIDRATAHDYEIVDLQGRFIHRYAMDGSRFEFAADHHWDGRGHREAAAAVAASTTFATLFPGACQDLGQETVQALGQSGSEDPAPAGEAADSGRRPE